MTQEIANARQISSGHRGITFTLELGNVPHFGPAALFGTGAFPQDIPLSLSVNSSYHLQCACALVLNAQENFPSFDCDEESMAEQFQI